MFRRVGERFRCHVVRGDLDGLGEPPFDRDFEVDGNRRAAGECSQRGAEPALGEVRRVNAAARSLGVRSWRRRVRLRSATARSAGRSDRQERSASTARTASPSATSRCCVPSWRFALDAAAGFVRRGHDSASRDAASSDLLSAFAIAVATSSVNEARRASVPGGNGPSDEVAVTTPQRCPFDDDRASNRRLVARLPCGDADRVGGSREVVETSGPARLRAPSTRCSCPRSATVLPIGNADLRGAPRGDNRHAVVRFEATRSSRFRPATGGRPPRRRPRKDLEAMPPLPQALRPCAAPPAPRRSSRALPAPRRSRLQTR